MQTSSIIASNFYSGGLAELVSKPTPLTYSFLRDWFCGAASVGKAMELLRLPCEKISESVLQMHGGELVVNLAIEEKTLYAKTLFLYISQTGTSKNPQLHISLKKIANPVNLFNTLTILMAQSRWIAFQPQTVTYAKQLADMISESNALSSIVEVDMYLSQIVWPSVIAIGFLCEFFHQILISEAGEDVSKVESIISHSLIQKDWFFRSFSDQELVKKRSITIDEYLNSYGIRADKDYELLSPRWKEIPNEISQRIAKNTSYEKKVTETISVKPSLTNRINTVIELQFIRSEAKRKALIHFAKLRQLIINEVPTGVDASHLTKKQLLEKNFQIIQKKSKLADNAIQPKPHQVSSGVGVGVSTGEVSGKVQSITNNNVSIEPGTIGIFPNASPEFGMLFTKCSGLFFLTGGRTSHGAILAREFQIPAIIDKNAQYIEVGSIVKMNGNSGEWVVIKHSLK